jgi:tripartite-type tricarboxylate transporter receptor subunit TctC
MSPALAEKINAEVRRGLKTEAALKQLAKENIETQDWDMNTVTRFMRNEIERWAPLAKSVEGLH